MNESVALVTGAAGFLGSRVVEILRRRGIRVRAGLHRSVSMSHFPGTPNVETVPIDILNRHSLLSALEGVDSVYHFAALVDAAASRENLFRINEEGTRNVWECAAARGVCTALYCSSVAVYGLLANSTQPISEDVTPRAIEPYGRSKLKGELAAREVAATSGPATVTIRPVAVFGPGDSTAFGRLLRKAAVTKLISPGTSKAWKFNFVHVEDVAEAAVHLMHVEGAEGQVFNVGVNSSVSFEDAFQAYLRALERSGRSLWRARIIARCSAATQRLPGVMQTLIQYAGNRIVFTVWHPGFDLTYSSKKLLDASFRFKWEQFDDVLLSCLD